MSGINLLIVPRAANKDEKDRIRRFVKILELSGEKFKFIYHLKEEKLKKIIDEPFIEGLCIPEYFKEKSWKNAYKILDGIGEVKQIMVFLNSMSSAKHLGDENKVKRDYNLTFTKDDYGTSFDTVNVFLKNTNLIIYLANKYNADVKHIIYDPQEFVYNTLVPKCKNYYFYALERNNSSFLPYIEYGFFYKASEQLIVKEYDFTFGCSIMTHDRDYVQDTIDLLKKNLQNHTANLFIKNKFTKEKNYVSFPEYQKLLAKSKFTLVIPSYDKEEFSVTRFIEALVVDCIPLILDRCKLDKAFIEHPDFLAIINKYLLVNENNISLALTLDYDKILCELKETNDYKKLLDINYYKKYVEELMKCIL